MSCPNNCDSGLVGFAHTNGVPGQFTICGRCPEGHRLGATLQAIAEGRPVGMRNAACAKDGDKYPWNEHALIEPPHTAPKGYEPVILGVKGDIKP